jgi:hypothetical protein
LLADNRRFLLAQTPFFIPPATPLSFVPKIASALFPFFCVVHLFGAPLQK